LHFEKDVVNVFHMNHVTVGVEHFNETAHVGAFEFLGQIDKETDGGDSVLKSVGLVANLDGKTEAAHTDFIDAQIAVVTLALFVVKFGLTCTLFYKRGMTIFAHFQHPESYQSGLELQKELQRQVFAQK